MKIMGASRGLGVNQGVRIRLKDDLDPDPVPRENSDPDPTFVRKPDPTKKMQCPDPNLVRKSKRKLYPDLTLNCKKNSVIEIF